MRRFVQLQPDYRDGSIRRFVLEFAAELQPGSEALDIGCGPGCDVALLRERGINAIGIDISEAMVEYATAEYGPYFEVLDLRNLHVLGEDRFQGALCVASLIHLPRSDWGQALTRIWKILRPYGKLYLTVKEGVGTVKDDRLGMDCPRFVQLCTKTDLLSELEAAHFLLLDFRQTSGSATEWLHTFAEKPG